MRVKTSGWCLDQGKRLARNWSDLFSGVPRLEVEPQGRASPWLKAGDTGE